MGAAWLDVDIAAETVALTADERIYSVEAVLRTAYWFTDRAYIFVSKPSEHTLRVHIKTKPPTLQSPRPQSNAEIAQEFGNALLDNQLRESVEQRTGKIRELLVLKALSEARVLEEPVPGTPNDSVAEQQSINLIRLTP